ncbi:MAG: hypothetical protein LC776_18970 [Acidobacteria bacterium]|nr:hypothetical protein [Acidobacteriota bacterium]
MVATWPVTMSESLGGFGLALVFAVTVSIPIALIPTLDRALMPWIIAGQAFPKEAYRRCSPFGSDTRCFRKPCSVGVQVCSRWRTSMIGEKRAKAEAG